MAVADLDPVVPAVGHDDVPLVVHGHPVRPRELTVLRALRAKELQGRVLR